MVLTAYFSHFVVPSCKLELAIFSALLRIQDGFPTEAVGGWLVQLHYIATLWLHLASWNLPDYQLCREFKIKPDCGNDNYKTQILL